MTAGLGAGGSERTRGSGRTGVPQAERVGERPLREKAEGVSKGIAGREDVGGRTRTEGERGCERGRRPISGTGSGGRAVVKWAETT